MRKITVVAVFWVLLLLYVPTVVVLGQGAPLQLGQGQELHLDLPLEPDKAYDLSIEFRTDLEDAEVTMTLCAIRGGNELVEQRSVTENLGAEGQWRTLSLEGVETGQSTLRWELVLTANQEGRYFWKDLKATRIHSAAQNTQQYWSEKLAIQGPFYTGLVVDARHLNVQRGISPRIYSESGQLIYGGVLASQELVQERGVVGYGPELTPELLSRLEVSPDYPYAAPLVVEALAPADPTRTGVYISQADTARVLEAMVEYDFFARYAVIFLVR